MDKGELQIIALTLQDEIHDIIEDNSPETINQSPELMTSCIKKIEALRIEYRSKHRALRHQFGDEEYERQFQKEFTLTTSEISKFIRTLNQFIQQQSTQSSQSLKEVNDQKASFIVEEIRRSIKYLHASSTCDVKRIENEDLKQRKKLIDSQTKELCGISEKMKDLIGLRPNMLIYEELKIDYNDLYQSHRIYQQSIQEEIKLRELDKHDNFKNTMLNIKLPTFTGYDSSIDIYTFNQNFDKLYGQTVPKALQPDLLKNNHLAKHALALVKNVTTISEIWQRLKAAFGDSKILLKHKLSELNKFDLAKHKDPSKLSESLSKVTNTMRDLMHLASIHSIENDLYYGDGMSRILNLLGEERMMRYLTQTCDQPKEGKAKWRQMMEFLEREIQIQQQRSIINQTAPSNTTSSTNSSSRFGKQQTPHKQSSNRAYLSYGNGELNQNTATSSIPSTQCVVCGENNHVQTNGPRGTKLVQYFSCKQFVQMTPSQRFAFLKNNGLCHQCLYPGAQINQGKHRDGKCQHDFICKHPAHERFTTKKHVLVCDEHKSDQQNKDVLEHYKSRCILKQPVQQYSKEIQIFSSHHSTYQADTSSEDSSRNRSSDQAMFMLQTISIDGGNYTIFYDSGCSNFICRHHAVTQLGTKAVQQYSGTIKMGGVGGITSISNHGIYRITIPLQNGNRAVFTGACLDKITEAFPYYPLNGEVINDIKKKYIEEGNDPTNLPSVPCSVGGEVDLMMGIKYFRYFPKFVFQLPSGLTIYKSHFANVDGSCGVIGGPHEIFNNIGQVHPSTTNFILNQQSLYQLGYHINPDVRLLGYPKGQSFNITIQGEAETSEDSTTQQIELFNKAESAGSEIQYRCNDCRGCNTCKSQSTEIMSITEEVEQEMINQSVTVDITNHRTIAKLPLMYDPATRLLPNRDVALKVYNQQVKKLSKSQKDRDDVIKSEGKLQALGYVEYVKNLPEDIQINLKNGQYANFIPWRAVWKENSISTPCRIVYDASMPTKSGYSLNDLLAKGRNNMNKLVDIFVRWRGHAVAFHTDVQKMYNSVHLDSIHWGLQRYLWQESLDASQPPEEKVIKTLIYGVKSSGNQAERGLRETANLLKDQYPEVHRIVTKNTYVDDILSGGKNETCTVSNADDLEVVVNHGGYTLKGFTFSGQPPPQSLSNDGESVSVAGLKWFPEEDTIALDVQQLNFSRKHRGRKPKSILSVPEKLSRRQCVSKVAELFDITGIITPIIATMKIDLHELVRRKMDWDDILPDNLRQVWTSHFEMMSEINNIRFRRAVIPEDAQNLDVQTLDFGDASKDLVCAAIYIRFKRRNNKMSCQLIFARSRVVPDDLTQPRAELVAALLNSHTGEVVKKSFGDQHKSSIKFTDSQITLYWICNPQLKLKQWTRNRVSEIHRFSNPSQWRYVKSKDMIADIGTRKCESIDVVKPDSPWINGFPWMQLDEEEFPAHTASEITLNSQDLQNVKKESKEVTPEERCHFNDVVPNEVSLRYQFSNYIVDPNSRRFTTVVRILAIVLKFIRKCRTPSLKSNQSKQPVLTNEDIEASETYFFKKATTEVKKFNQPSKYVKLSHEKDGILRYSGRILPTDQVSIVGKATTIMKDLHSLYFSVPLVDKHSPLAYSIVMEIHWNHPTAKHSGIETTWRYVLQQAYIIEGRSLVKSIRSTCLRCRYLLKQQLNVTMGPLSQQNLTIAPPFYFCQADLAGPLLSYSQHHKRTTVKIWLLVICCATTTATKIKVMEDYGTTSFLQAFSRVACEVGYPKKLLVDEGSQLIKGCESMRISFSDLQHQLHQDVKVEFEMCPVGGHNVNGRVERKIREIRRSIEKSVHNHRLSLLQWETLVSSIANSINNLPLAMRNVKGDFEVQDIITPNRLLMGRNNDRCPTQMLEVSNDYDKLLRSNKKIFDTWFECWLTAHVPNLIYQPKWYNSDDDLKPGDVVLFLKQESVLSSTYQYGMVKSVNRSRDEKVRKVVVSYRNANENVTRETTRSSRSLVLIHGVDEVDVSSELYYLKSK